MTIDGEEIMSPPFPTEVTTVQRLVQHIDDLRDWVVAHRLWANEQVADLGAVSPLIPADNLLPAEITLDRLLSVALTDIFTAYSVMRNLREDWDAVVRRFEDAWDCKACIHARLHLFQTGLTVLENVGVSPEVREMRNQRVRSQIDRQVDRVMRHMHEVRETEQREDADAEFHADPNKLTQSELDQLFYSEDRLDVEDDDGHITPEDH